MSEISKEISKEQIAGLLRVLNRCSNLAERLKRNLQKKPKLDVLEKSWLAEHIHLIADINNSNFVLSGLNDVAVIQLEPERAESLPPPSAPTSVDEPEEEEEEEKNYCLLCNKHLTEPCFLSNENGKIGCFCDPCYKIHKEKKNKLLLDETDRLQDEKDRLSTEVSQQKIALRTKTLAIIKNLESIGYENLDTARKKRLTLAKKRIAEEDNFLD
jgi:hypothetical protein